MAWLVEDDGTATGGKKAKAKKGKKNKAKFQKEEFLCAKRIHIFVDGLLARGVRDDTEAEVYDACGLDRPIPSEILTEPSSSLNQKSDGGDEAHLDGDSTRWSEAGIDDTDAAAKANASRNEGLGDAIWAEAASATEAAKAASLIAFEAAFEAERYVRRGLAMAHSASAVYIANTACLQLDEKMKLLELAMSVFAPLQSVCEIATMYELGAKHPNGKGAPLKLALISTPGTYPRAANIYMCSRFLILTLPLPLTALPKSWVDLKTAHDMQVQDDELDEE
jgi:hypothetical protein